MDIWKAFWGLVFATPDHRATCSSTSSVLKSASLYGYFGYLTHQLVCPLGTDLLGHYGAFRFKHKVIVQASSPIKSIFPACELP
ncbi:hypothetical protein BX666DRAFT_1884185 [Dichotomocladium elegans]|nr:hypothetical protein BX666DRAFT_1884185 [Dichotomocladium elegans]